MRTRVKRRRVGTAPNSFYSHFDKETLEERHRDVHRTPFEVDRDRIIHSYAFRRLQAKTQVFKPGEYDFYRTRLTHTIEVSQIGRSISALLRRKNSCLREDFYIDSDLVEAACLAHDLGHAPFGHAGEQMLNKLMDMFGGFEGNAQTLRLLTETIWHDSSPRRRCGMSPTRALMDGVLKYKKTRSAAQTQNHFVYDEQQNSISFVHRGLPHEFEGTRSIECQIMDWADDVAYSVGDFVDGVYARFITTEKLRKWEGPKRHPPLIKELIKAIRDEKLSEFAAHKIGEFIKDCELTKANNPETRRTNRYRYKLKFPDERRAEQECLKQISRDLVFASPAVEQLEYKAQGMVEQLFGILRDNYRFGKPPRQHLLNEDVERTLDVANDQPGRMRRLCDYISGMSDDYIARTCRRLTDSQFGSIVDLV